MNRIVVKYFLLILLFLVAIIFYFSSLYIDIKNINSDIKLIENSKVHPYINKVIKKENIGNKIKLKLNDFVLNNERELIILKNEKAFVIDIDKIKKEVIIIMIIFFLFLIIIIVYDYLLYNEFKKMKLYKIYEKEHYIADKILYFLTFSLSHKLSSPLKIIERGVVSNCDENKGKIMNAVSEIKETIISMNSYYEWYNKLYSLFHIFYISKSIIGIFEEEVDVRIILDSELKKYSFKSHMLTDRMFLFLIILLFSIFVRILSTKIQVFTGKYDDKRKKLEIFIFNDGNNINDINLVGDNIVNEFKDIVNILKYSQIDVKVYYDNEKGFNVIVLVLDAEKIVGDI
jgi:hypothetical protein